MTAPALAPVKAFIQGPAGSGKTARLIEEVVRLLGEGATPDQCLMVTATENAAGALRKRLARTSCAQQVETMGIMALGQEFLQVAAHTMGEAASRLLTTTESAVLAADLGAFDERPWALKGLAVFGAHANTDEELDLPPLPDGVTEEQFDAFQEDLFGLLARGSALLPTQVLPAAASLAAASYRFVLVDDAQLLNAAALTFLRRMASEGVYLAYDAAQAYQSACPCADPAAVTRLAQKHPQAPVILLDTPAGPVAGFIATATGAAPASQEEGAVEPSTEALHIKWREPQDEFEGIARYIQLLRKADASLAPEDFCIAVPNTAWARNLARQLDTRMLASTAICSDFFAQDPRTADDAAGAYELLLMAVNPDDQIAVRTWCGLGDPTCRVTLWRRLEAWCATQKLDPIAGLERLLATHDVPFEGAIELRTRYGKGRQAADLLAQLKGLSLANRLVGAQNTSAMVPVTGRIGEEDTPSQVLERMSMRIFDPVFSDDPTCVRIGTPNRFAGMSPAHMIVAGAVEGLVPTIAQAQDEAVHARFFAACGKAAKTLTVSGFQTVEADLAKRLKLPTGRAKRDGQRTLAVVKRSPYLEAGAQQAPESKSGEQVLLGLEP